MLAPSNTEWGNIVGGYGRLGISCTYPTQTATSTTLKVQVWFWSKYSCSDSSNTLYFDNTATSLSQAVTDQGSVSVNTTVASGDGWSTSNQQLLKEFTYTYTRSTVNQARYLCARLINVDRVGATMTVWAWASISALDHYTVTYNANGGSGAPSSQTKYYGKSLILSSTKPTRTGYTFQGWATSASGSVAYAAGANYTTNAAATLYAVWTANTYTVQYNANGGTGAPGNQSKTYGVTLKLSSTKPTRTGYSFKGWGTSASASTVAYAAGANYTANAAVTLYAIWERSYTKPKIYNFTVERCDANGTLNDNGESVLVKFDWETTEADPYMEINISGPGGLDDAIDGSGTSGSFSKIYGPIDTESSYDIGVMVEDSGGDSTATRTLASMTFPLDVKSGGAGIAFGKAAELDGVAEFAYEGKFNKPVYGKALGMDRLPAIPENSDLDDYREPGCYAVYSDAIAKTIANCPCDNAGRVEVWSATGEGIRLEQWSYLRQRYISRKSEDAVWERVIARGAENVWNFSEWWKSSLTPSASQKIYSKAAITVALQTNVATGAVNTYTKIPLSQVVSSTSDRLTVTSGSTSAGGGSIRIGSGISYVKVSGQMLVKCGSVTGNRHLRLQKESGSTTTSVAWTCVYATASSNTVFPIAPIIVPVKEGDMLKIAYYTGDSADSNQSGNSTNGWQTYLTVEEL